MTSIATKSTATPVSTRFRIAAGIVILAAVAVIVGTLIAMDSLQVYQITANIVLAGAMTGAAVGMLRGRTGWDGRALAVLLAWVLAIGVTLEAGDFQNRENDTGALGATNTEYFLPGVVWMGLGVLFAVAVAVMMLTKRGRGHA